jgi:high-affinity iron transporter
VPHFHLFKSNYWGWVLGLVLSVMLLLTAPAGAVASPQQDLQQLDTYIEQAIAKLEAQDLAEAATTYNQFRESWFEVEDSVKESSRQAYREIEDAMGNVKFAFSVEPSNPDQLESALKELQATNQKFIAGKFSSTTAPTTTRSNSVTIASLAQRLDRVEAALQKQDLATAISEVKSFQTDWVEVEGFVAGKSRQAYVAIENNMAKAYAALRSTPPNLEEAKTAIATLKTDLQPFAEKTLRYNLFDSAVILLREGMEALLVLVALCAFLVKSDNGDKSRWIWIGAGAGILASVLTALVIHLVFANIAVGSNRELLEGLTGLVAAIMLFYVSYWLHSKSSMGAWQGYIQEKTTVALAQNSVFSLALLAFLAVFREGAETVLFYIGIAPSISTFDLLGGLAVGSLILVVVAVLMLGLGLRIPLKPFFLFTSLLIYYLGFKFVGSGIHALQVAGLLPADTASFLPSVDALGLYPTWETTLVQLAIVLIALGVVLYNRSHAPRTDA